MHFSLIVPVYNVAEFLPRCLNSLLEQTYENIEIILVDDGSTDSSGKICDEYAAKDSRISVIHKPNGGAADARNVGMNVASGEYVAFVDADDYLEPDAFEKLLPAAESEADIITADGFIHNPSGEVDSVNHYGQPGLSYPGKEYLIETIRNHGCISVIWAKLFKRSFLLENGLLFKTGRLFEDEEFMPRTFSAASSVLRTDVRFYHYLVREGSTMRCGLEARQAESLLKTMREYVADEKSIADESAKELVLDRFVSLYLNLYAKAALYSSAEGSNKRFLLRNAFLPRTRLKALLFAISPLLFCKVFSIKEG